MNPDFWRGRAVFMSGHTGFKGSWMSLWLQRLGAEVAGYALEPPTLPSLFEQARVADGMTSRIADIRDRESLAAAMAETKPDIVFHLAAQPLVRQSYVDPLETFETNVMGTANLLEAARQVPSVRAVVVITTDKCYHNRELDYAYRETDPMGGKDPYSASKGCAELVTASYRTSFFSKPGTAAVASARAGNVVGGGDWATDRLVPDILKSFEKKEPVLIRHPHAVRPWQYVLEPLSGYLRLAEALIAGEEGADDAWNFGPQDADAQPVSWIAHTLTQAWGEGASWQQDGDEHPHEAGFLKLDSSKAHCKLNWRPRLDLAAALQWVVAWHRIYLEGGDARAATLADIERYEGLNV